MNTIKDRLRAMGIRPSKLKGQNFLADDFFIEQIIQFGAPRSTEHLVEIGPGLGALTAELARFPKLTLIEIEPKLCRIMATRYPKAEVINADACTVDFSTIGTNLTLFGNLPYAFSTDIMMNVVGQARSLSRAVFLLQKEYAQRLAAAPDTEGYSSISIAVQMQADVRLGPIAGGELFYPTTEVESQLLSLKFLPEPRIKVKDPVFFRRVVQSAFGKRRKKLENSLVAAGLVSSATLAKALEAANINGDRRPETLSIVEFGALSDALQ